MANSIAYDKAFSFAVKIVDLYKFLTVKEREYVISKQVLRSGTSVGANIKEALQGNSKKDFTHKMNIALKEASETEYWLDLLIAGEYLDQKTYTSLVSDCRELIKILVAIVKKSRQSLN